MAILGLPNGGTQPTRECITEVPVGVVKTNAVLISGLKRDSFAIPGKSDLTIREMVYDTGPRRIVFVVDRTSKLQGPAPTLVDSIIEKILQSARDDDRFGVVFADRPSIPIGDSGSVRVRFEKVKGQPHSRNAYLLDAVAEASDLLQPPKVGDAIFLFAGDDGLAQSHSDYKKLYQSLGETRTRVFGVLFGIYLMGNYTMMGLPLAPSAGGGIQWDLVGGPDERTVHSLTWGTGGYYRQETTDGLLQRYKLTDDSLQAMTTLGMQMYGAIAEFYRVEVSSQSSRSKPRSWTLQLSSSVPKIENKHVLYPRQLPTCAPK